MAHNVEPMDLDSIDSEFDNKENSFRHSNVLQCTEKGYEELDVSELNMKLRYSITPAASPMSKSYTHCIDNRNLDSDDSLNCTSNDVNNLTVSYNSTLTKNDNINKLKSLPLQSLPKEQFFDGNRNTSVIRQLDTAITAGNNTITICSNEDESLSLPSSSSSTLHTPEATSPVKDMPKDGGSPIMRGLKSVLNMFRPSTSPIPPAEGESNIIQTPGMNPASDTVAVKEDTQKIAVSTPILAHRNKESGSKRSSPLKESIVFNDEIEKELQWKDETTIFFNHEKIPKHKLFLLQGKPTLDKPKDFNKSLNSTVEYMDISHNDSQIDRTLMDVSVVKSDGVESDAEFLDCETTFTKNLTPEKDVVSQQDVIAKDTASSSSNVTMEHLVKQASKVILNITVPVSDNNMTINSVLEGSIENSNTENVDVHSNPGILEEQLLQKSINTLLENTIDIVKETHISPKENTIQVQSDDAPATEVSLDSIEINITENIQIDDNAITNDVKEISFSKEHEALAGSNQINKYEVSQTIFESNPDSIVTNFELDSLEPYSKSDLSDINNIKVDKNIQENITVVDTCIQEPTISLPECVPNEAVVESVEEVPADIPLPDDEEFDKSLTVNTTNSQFHIKTTDIVDCPKLPPNCAGEDVVAGSNKQMCIEDETSNPILDINATLDLVSPMNFNQSDLSQILKDIDCILNADCTDSVIDKKETNSLLKSEDLLEKHTQNLTMDFGESALRIETLPDILNHTTATLSLENVDAEVSPDIKIPMQTTSASVVQETQGTEVDSELKVLGGQLFIDTKVEVEDNSNDTKLAKYEAVQHILDNETEDTKNEDSHLNEEVFSINDISKNITADNKSTLLLEPSAPNQNQEVVSMKMTNDKQLDIDIEQCQNISDEIYKHPVDRALDFDIKETVDRKPQECDVQESVGLKNNDQLIIMETEKHDCYINKHSENHDFNLEKENQNKSLFDQQHDVPVINSEGENQNNCTVECQDPDKHNLVPISNVINDKVTQEIAVEENIEGQNIITIATNTIHNYKSEEINKIEVEKSSDDQISNDENVTVNKQHLDDIIVTTDTLINNMQTTIEQSMAGKDLKNIDEEIIISENNSPYVSVAANLDKFSGSVYEENLDGRLEDNITMKEGAGDQPSSPPIVSKGYNFNFDDINDPFASKSKIRQSPPPSSHAMHNYSLDEKPTIDKEISKNKRLIQTEKKKPLNKRKFNATFNKADKAKESIQPMSNVLYSKNDNSGRNVSKKDIEIVEKNLNVEVLNNVNDIIQENIKLNEDTVIKKNHEYEQKLTETLNDTKILSSEQPMFNTQGELSNECVKSRNVFNIPEIDDINFNPFATKTKMRQSPPPGMDIDNPFATRNKIDSSPNVSVIVKNTDNLEFAETKTPVDKMETELMEKESLTNLSATTSSSKATDDKDITVREVHTEDEDTEEGPFLEAEDNDDKISNFDDDNADMMQFPDYPTQEQENAETGELFIDAQAFEFLLNRNATNMVADSGKESLFLKFDPLFAKRISSDGVFAALSKIQNRQSTPSKLARTKQDTLTHPTTQPSSSQGTQTANTYEFEAKTLLDVNSEDQNMTTSKPMMVVTPAVNPVPLPRKSITPTRTNRRSLTFTSPAMAVIDRLLSMSANNSLLGEEPVSHVSQEQHEAELAITQLRELLAEKEIHVYNLRLESKELRERLSTMDTQIKTLESEGQERLRKINELNEKLTEKSKINKSMAAVVEEYERTIASLIAETEQDKKRHAEERIKLINERDEQIAHLASMEVSFNDLHMKYEKSKQVILTYKANEDVCKKSLKEYEENLTKMQNNYELLKQHATSKLNHANQELEKMNRAHEAEVLKLNAMMKRKELHITSLEETLAQKTKANEELTAICEELINKVG